MPLCSGSGSKPVKEPSRSRLAILLGFLFGPGDCRSMFLQNAGELLLD
jgi:hypothetical protein